MALTTLTGAQLTANLNALYMALGNPMLRARFPDGREVQYRTVDDIRKAIAETGDPIREASAQKTGKSTLADHRRGDGPNVAGFPWWGSVVTGQIADARNRGAVSAWVSESHNHAASATWDNQMFFEFVMMPVIKPVDFPASARRHFEDAKLLETTGRFPNAGHLYGYVAECGLKALLTWHGHPTDAEGSPVQSSGFRRHVDQLVITGTFASLRVFVNSRSGSKYLSMIPSISAFSDWKVEHRYFSEAALPASFANWKAAAHEVGRMLDQARLDGKK